MFDSDYIKDLYPVDYHFCRFLEFVHEMDLRINDSTDILISFTDTNGFLGTEEGYKSCIAEIARNELHFSEWKKSWIGTGRIAANVFNAVSKANNLINKFQQINFKNRLNPDHAFFCPDAERILYEIYRGSDERSSFEMAVNAFGAKYDTIAYLFFLKDSERFLPISPGNIDKSFRLLGIDFQTSYNCNWDNYCGFISIIRDIQKLMNIQLPLKAPARLIDAHSFVWILHEDKYTKMKFPEETLKLIEFNAETFVQHIISDDPKRISKTSNTFARNSKVVKTARDRAKGICQLCREPAPFNDSNGIPYLEVHHVVWLSRDGKDSTDNVVALCPNCHAKMHIVDDTRDVNELLRVIKKYS